MSRSQCSQAFRRAAGFHVRRHRWPLRPAARSLLLGLGAARWGGLACRCPRAAGFELLGFSLAEQRARANGCHVNGYFVAGPRVSRAIFACRDPHGRPFSVASSRLAPYANLGEASDRRMLREGQNAQAPANCTFLPKSGSSPRGGGPTSSPTMACKPSSFDRNCKPRNCWLRIPMMSISHSDLMPIRSERSDAGLSQFETVIDVRQDFSLFSVA